MEIGSGRDGDRSRTSLFRLINRRRAPSESGAKRILDVIFATAALVFLLPLLLVIAIAVVADSRGPVFFKQRRTGLNGREFRIYKFRSMRVVEDGPDVRHATRGDARVTSVGAFLRRASLDELPQLLNVLMGDMSLVGPRPHAVAHDQHYGALVPHYVHRFRARPGITGLAQIQGLRGEIHSLEHMELRVLADNQYIDGWSLWVDANVLVKTVVVVFFQKAAY